MLVLRTIPAVVLGAVVGVSLAACSGGGGGGGAACAPASHRATASACAATQIPALADAGPPSSCATDADCATAGSEYTHCLSGTCSFDECLSDADCANGGVCGCSTEYYGGNAAYHPNVCVSASCHVDSDCGSGGVCAPTLGTCGSLDSFHCGSASAPACGTDSACGYSDEVGRFTCEQPALCNG
jgi:hypothetical protein